VVNKDEYIIGYTKQNVVEKNTNRYGIMTNLRESSALRSVGDDDAEVDFGVDVLPRSPPGEQIRSLAASCVPLPSLAGISETDLSIGIGIGIGSGSGIGTGSGYGTKVADGGTSPGGGSQPPSGSDAAAAKDDAAAARACAAAAVNPGCDGAAAAQSGAANSARANDEFGTANGGSASGTSGVDVHGLLTPVPRVGPFAGSTTPVSDLTGASLRSGVVRDGVLRAASHLPVFRDAAADLSPPLALRTFCRQATPDASISSAFGLRRDTAPPSSQLFHVDCSSTRSSSGPG